MTLDQLWDKVNADYREVKSLSRNIEIDLYAAIGNAKMWVQDFLWWAERTFSPNTRDLMNRVAGVFTEIQNEISRGYAHLDDRINRYHWNIEHAFVEHLNSVIGYIQDAVDLTWQEAVSGGGGFEEYVNRAIDSVIDRIDSEIYNVERSIDQDIATVKNLITTKYNQVKNWVDENFGGVWDWVTGGLDKLWTDTKAYALQLYADAEVLLAALRDELEDAILAVRTSIVNYYQQAVKYVDEWMIKAKNYIDAAVRNLERAIVSIKGDIEVWVDDRISKLWNSITLAIGIIEDSLDDLAIAADWRFGFFRWFLLIPELAMLNLLLRNEEMFDHWRPYWQAFFARVLEEA